MKEEEFVSNTPQYIFGYGSLVETESRVMTSPGATYAWPAIVKGIKRGWFDRVDAPGYSPTYLGALADPASTCNGVIFAVTDQQLVAYDRRETGYKREKIAPAMITMLDGADAAPQGDIWYYANQQQLPATPDFPIVQSYIDVCINGCLEIESTYPLAKSIHFAGKTVTFSEMFLLTCSDWSDWWVNDRLYPRRPFVYVPNASTIDNLIQKVLGRNVRQIAIEPASWESAVQRTSKQES
jgi:Gamma-glutamyl cyclotransferase, AIG2-like